MEKSGINTLYDDKWNIRSNHPAWKLINMNIVEIIEKFLSTKKSIKTKESYFTDLKKFFELYEIYDCNKLIELYWNYGLSDIISEYINSVKKLDPQDPNRITNPRTVNRKAYALSSFFKFLQKRYKFNYNPVMFDAINTPKYSSTNSVSNDELEWILKFMKNKYKKSSSKSTLRNLRNYLIFCFLSFSLRRNEISKLRWQDINHSEKYIQVLQKWNSYKLIPLPETIYKLLIEFKALKWSYWYTWDYIFTPFSNNKTKNTNKPISTDYLYSLVIKSWNEYQINEEMQEIYKQLNKLSNRKKYLKKKKHGSTNLENINKEIKEIDDKINNLKIMKKELNKNNKQISCHSFRKTFVEQAILRWDDIIQIQNATWHSNSNMISYYQTINKTKHNSINEIEDLY